MLVIKTGYNLYVLPKDQNFNVLPGDMIAWGPTANGRIAQKAGKGNVYHFSGLDAQALQSGTNVSINQSQVIPELTYMINIIGSQASMFEFSHQYDKSGMYWAQVNFTDTLGNDLEPIVQPILIQTPLTNIKTVYPTGFSFFGARLNREVKIIVNISTDANVTVSWTHLNSSSLLKRETLQSLGNSFVVDRLNRTFPSLGTYVLLVDAVNDVSVINTTVLVHVVSDFSDFNASVISETVYLGATTTLNVSVSGANVKFKWCFGDGSWTPFISNTTVVHRFSKTGALNASVTASNLAFTKRIWLTMHVLNPLSVSVPLKGAVNVVANMSCSLTGPFSSDQYYYWDYGDGATEKGLHKIQVSHIYTRGGTYNVSVKLKNDVVVFASSEILVLEPVSGLMLDNITGIELFDNKTFIARTTTGNNLTYEWYLYSNNTITILICTNNSIELSFNTTGIYTISVNVSNSISSEFASVSFSVQLRISGLGITAFPNPAPSNSTITFNVTKGAGSDVKYRLDFGDGFILRDFPEHYLFNRTFTSGQWQIIFQGENVVNHVIVFYNVTVQDPVDNITVSFDAETEFHGHNLVAVGTETSFHSKVSQGTDVYFRWSFGDGFDSNNFKGLRMLSGETNHSIGHSFPRKGEFNVTVDAFNVISQRRAWLIVRAQERIEGFQLEVNDHASPGNSITFKFSQTKGNNVSYIINFGDGGSNQTVTSNSWVKTYDSVGVFNVIIVAVNQISSQEISKTITVQRQIQGLAFVHLIAAVEMGSSSVISWSISDGSDVKFVIDYGDGTAPQTLDTNVVGINVTVRHNYTSSGEYTVCITAYNLVGPNATIREKAVIDESIEGLVAYAKRSTIQMYQSAVIVASILKGSRVTFEFEFADGSSPLQTFNNTAIHQYRKHGLFNVTVTATNSLTSKQTQLNDTITVEKLTKPLEIRGLNISCQATTPGNTSEIRITYEVGFLFQCEVEFGDGTAKATFTDETLPLLLRHTFSRVGSFEVIVQCGNRLGNYSVNTTARVDDLITGLKFKTGSGVIDKEFGEPVVIEWIWTTGTNIDLSVILSGHGSIASQQTGQTGLVELNQSLCPTPGEYVVNIQLSNSVSPPQKLEARVTFLEDISGLTIRFNPVVRTDFPLPVYVSVDSGLDVKVRWIYGDGSDTSRQNNGFGKQKYIDSHAYHTQGEYEVEVVASNKKSVQNARGKVTIIDPVQGFSLHQQNTVIWPSRNITFQFNRGPSVSRLVNATYRIKFGNGEKSQDVVITPEQTQFKHNYSYSRPGCYKAKLIIWNFVSRVELSAPVQIIQPIINAELKASNSEYSVHPGSSGRGPTGNTFPFEYPVSFTITQDNGTCLTYDWSFGDYDELKSVSSAVTTHAYPLPGRYNVVAKVYNSLTEVIQPLTITLQHSVMGLYLAANGSARPGESVTFVVFCSSLGNNSQFVFNPGEGYNITLHNFKNNSKLKAEKLLGPSVNFPFDPSSYHAKVYSHNYSSTGLFVAQVWAWNEASQQSSRTSVAVTEKSVPVPHVQIIGGRKSLVNITSLIFGKRFSLSSRVEILNNESYTVVFKWVVYKADSYRSAASLHVQLPPESGREVR